MMSDKLVKGILQGLLWVLLGASVLFLALFVYQSSSLTGMEELMRVTEPILVWTYVLLGLGAFVAVIFPVLFIVQNPRKAGKVLVAVLGLGLVLFVAYLMAESTPMGPASATANPDFSDTAVLVFSDTGIIATYILLGLSVLLLAVTGLRSLIANR